MRLRLFALITMLLVVFGAGGTELEGELHQGASRDRAKEAPATQELRQMNFANPIAQIPQNQLQQAMPNQSPTLLQNRTTEIRPIPAEPPVPIEKADFRFTGPFAYKNLSVFLIHGHEQMQGKNFLTLEEAMSRGLLEVNETGSVNELSVENRSKDAYIFIQAGEIVKGGRQDRALGQDLIVPPRSSKIPIAAFCVEQSRWSKRGAESAQQFQYSKNALSSKGLKLAARHQNDQGAVWQNVAEMQNKLEASVGKSVRSGTSPSSLQLTLEDGDLDTLANEYILAIESRAKLEDDVIGMAYAINGAVNSAEVYGAHDLLAKAWPKLLRSAALEAIAEYQGESTSQASLDDVKGSLYRAEKEPGRILNRAAQNVNVSSESEDVLLFETRDASQGGAWVKRSYLVR